MASYRIGVASAGLVAAALVSAVAAVAQPTMAKNLIVNGNAEQGEASPNGYTVVPEVPGWTRKGKFTVVAYGAADFPSPANSAALGGGSKFFAGGPGNAGSALTQTIDVSSKKVLIDAGKARATMSGYLGGYGGQDDSLIATAVFLAQSGARLGAIKIGPVGAAARKLATGLIARQATGTVPKLTRAIRVTLGADRTAGDYNDGYADNLSLTLGR